MTDNNKIFTIMHNKYAGMSNSEPQNNSGSTGVDAEVLANMKTHYSGLMKVGATNFGGSSISTSIFAQIDTDNNKELSQEEINSANLDEIIINTIKRNKLQEYDAQEYFGESYTKSASQTDPNSSKTTTEQIIDNNIKQAITQILEYAEQHPENTRVQEYAKKLKEMLAQNSIIGTDVEHQDSVGQHLSASEDAPNGKILIDNRDQFNNFNPRNVLKTILHELGHAISGDDLDSVAEEVMVESIARELALEISGEEVFEYSMEYFASQYKGYPMASPGTHNIPKNAGIATQYVPQEVTMKDNVLTIRAETDEKGNRVEDYITYGDRKDADGNPLPVSAKRVIVNQSGEIVFSADYGEYDSTKRAFKNAGLVKLKQMSFEGNTNKTLMKLGLK